MARTREKNVTAAQWNANGRALGAGDLTAPGSHGYADNVFSPAVQRRMLPDHVYRRLNSTVEHGELLDPTLADQVARA